MDSNHLTNYITYLKWSSVSLNTGQADNLLPCLWYYQLRMQK